jgi:cytochrome b561
MMKRTLGYTSTAIALHWILAVALVAVFGVGFYMHGMALSPMKLRVYSWHKWAGVTLALLAMFRIVWRLRHRPAPLPLNVPRWQEIVAENTHRLLYVLMLAIPVSGWLMSSAKGFQTVYFGIIPLPDLVAKNRGLGDALAILHKSLNYTLALLVIAHVGAALKHHLIDRDGVLARMLPFLGNARSTT